MSDDPRPLIVHVVYRLGYGGLENGLVNLLNNLPAAQFRHAVICLAGAGAFRQRIRRTDVEVHSIDKRPGKDLMAYVRMWRLLRRLRPSVVHTRNLGTIDMQWVAWAAGVRGRLHSEHGWEASDSSGTNSRSLLIRRLCRRVIGRYLTVSADLARWLHEQVGVPRSRIVVIANGVDTVKFSPAGARAADLPWREAGDGPSFVIGTVGRLDPVKNQAALIEAFARVSAQGATFPAKPRLVIVGDGPLSRTLADRVSRLGLEGQVWLAGARDDIPELMRSMDLFVLPSLNEGMSNTLLEAMACGLPLVAARVGGNPELIEQGVNGTLYEPAEAGGLERVLRSCAGQPDQCAAQGRQSRRIAEERFSLQGMMVSYSRLYSSLIPGSSAACVA